MPIHLWRTERLAKDLADRAVSERDAARYMMAGAVLYVQANYSALWFGAYRDWAFFFELFLVLVVSLIGVHECFKANGAEEGQDFIVRLCALAVPVGIKLAIVALILGQGVYFAFPYLFGSGTFRDPDLVYRYVSFLMPVTFTFVYYWRIAYHMAAIRSGMPQRASAP